MNVDLAILLVTTAGGAALLLFTTGRAGGYLVQPRTLKGVPVGPSATPGSSPTTPDVPGVDIDPNAPKPKNDWPVPKGNGGGEPDQGGPPPCKAGWLVVALLEQYAAEAGPYAIGRAKAPWPEVTGGEWQKGMDELFAEREESPGYYITAVVLKTLLAQGLDPNAFASGNFLYPGCVLPDSAFAPGTPLRGLVDAWASGSDEPLPGDANIDAEDS